MMKNTTETTAERNGKSIGGGDLWRVMRGGTCIGTIVHSHVTNLWHVTLHDGYSIATSSHDNRLLAWAAAGVWL